MPLFKQKKGHRGFFLKMEHALIRLSPFKHKKPSFFSRHAINFLNVSQCLGVVNDNLFKYLVIFLLIDLKGAEASTTILTWAGIVYVLPFLLFSSAAGVLADRFSKQRMIVILKWTECLIMLLGIAAFAFKSPWASYTLLFLISLQSALFSPPKYSIIPEFVEPKKIPKANGLITSFTYFGIILGTFFASFLTQVTGRNFPLTAAACTLIAALGFASSIFIPKTEAKLSKKRINPFFIYEIYSILRYAKRFPYLLTAIFGSASFLFVGAYFQLNVIPFAIQELGMSDVVGGYLFLFTAIGIAVGALFAGKVSKTRPEIGSSCIAGIGLSGVLIIVGLFPHSLIFVCCGFIALGVLGGFYIVPFDSFIQRFSPEEKRGQIVAASNFLSFCGVLIAPLMLFLFSNILSLTAAQGFIATSIVILIFVLFLAKNLSCFVFSSLAKCFVKPFYTVVLDNAPFNDNTPFVLHFHRTKQVYFYLLAALNPKLHLYHICPKKHFLDSLVRHFSAVDFLYAQSAEEVVNVFKKRGKADVEKGEIPCIISPFFPRSEEKKNSDALALLQQELDCLAVEVDVQKIARKEQFDRKLFKRPKVTFHFFSK